RDREPRLDAKIVDAVPAQCRMVHVPAAPVPSARPDGLWCSVAISPVSARLLKRRSAWLASRRGVGPIALIAARPSALPGGSKRITSRTSVPRACGASPKRTSPSFLSGASSVERQHRSSPGCSSVISASHSSAWPMTSGVRQCMRLSSSASASANWPMMRDSVSGWRHSRYSSSAGLPIVTALRTRTGPVFLPSHSYTMQWPLMPRQTNSAPTAIPPSERRRKPQVTNVPPAAAETTRSMSPTFVLPDSIMKLLLETAAPLCARQKRRMGSAPSKRSVHLRDGVLEHVGFEIDRRQQEGREALDRLRLAVGDFVQRLVAELDFRFEQRVRIQLVEPGAAGGLDLRQFLLLFRREAVRKAHVLGLSQSLRLRIDILVLRDELLGILAGQRRAAVFHFVLACLDDELATLVDALQPFRVLLRGRGGPGAAEGQWRRQ